MRVDNQKTWSMPVVVAGESTTRRSYITEEGQGLSYRRNCCHLQLLPSSGYQKRATENLKVLSEAENSFSGDPPKKATETIKVPFEEENRHSGSAVTPDGQICTRPGRIVKPVQGLNL